MDTIHADNVNNAVPVGHAFPDGNASGGFALLSFYFLLRQSSHPYRHYFLFLTFVVGTLFGVAQDMRGAHIVGYDLYVLVNYFLA